MHNTNQYIPKKQILCHEHLDNIAENKIINKKMGWEIAQYQEQQSIKHRMRFKAKELKASLLAFAVLSIVFGLSCWLATTPFNSTPGIVSNQWNIIWSVTLLAMIFEFLDSAAGMGYGTAFTPLLLIFGYEPLQIIPAIMIQQASAGLTSAYIHKEYGNVEWHIHPISETVKLWLIIASMGILAGVFSITSVYGLLHVAQVWIKLYVVVLLLAMGIISLINAKKVPTYHPKRMFFFGALAGFNKGIGGGGYGPVVTIGGLFSGVPAKTMMAITAFAEGTVCIASIITWFCLLNHGVVINFILLPSMILGSIFAVIAAPYAIRVFPEKMWKKLVPLYCCILAILCLWKLIPPLF